MLIAAASALLIVVSLRRLLFLSTILLTRATRRGPPPAALAIRDIPNVLVLIPCRDEERNLPGLCQSLERLDYPSQNLQFVLIDDGSSDDTLSFMRRWAADRAGRHVVSLPGNVGKAHALNSALDRFVFGEFIYVLDADHRPHPSALRRIVAQFEDKTVAGASGRTIATNALASPSAYYSSVESDVHQMVTMRAKDWLDLAPALLGSNCVYRRAALAACGGFHDGALLEDSDMTIRFYRMGYRVRFVPEAEAYHQVPQVVDGYIRQHARWGRGFYDVLAVHVVPLIRNRRLPWLLRIELVIFSLGYLDRFAFVTAAAMSALSFLKPHQVRFPRGLLALAFLAPLVQIAGLFWEQHVSTAVWVRLPLIPLFYLVDILAAAQAMANALLNRDRVWERGVRVRPFP
jgi:cellulose synthase/poly-beta-1,6-N-acetylglucosamine synthase-like glycosyltransferase